MRGVRYTSDEGTHEVRARARGMPLGIMRGMGYKEKETILEAGESALFYSDGLVEAHDPKGKMFGFPGLRTLVAEHTEQGSLVDFLIDELRSFTGEGWEQEDDHHPPYPEASSIREPPCGEHSFD